jgi:hypothetical protein
MPIRPDPAYAAAVSPKYGEFLGHYESEHGQAFADLFQKGGVLRAYLSYEKGREPGKFTDEYLSDLEQMARQRGLTLKILHVVN